MAVMPEIDQDQREPRAARRRHEVRYLNVNDKLADKDGRLFDGMMNERDKLHPTLKGYQVWADALKPILTELLGPPPRPTTRRRPPATPAPRVEQGHRSNLATVLSRKRWLAPSRKGASHLYGANACN